MGNTHPQAGILLPPPLAARHLEFTLLAGATRSDALATLGTLTGANATTGSRSTDGRDVRIDGLTSLVGFGASLVGLLGIRIPGLREFPVLSKSAVGIPATQRALWIWLRGEDRGEILLRSRAIEKALAPTFEPASIVDAFRYDIGRDLTGYEDGTENPKADAATDAAIVGRDAKLAPAGSSFVAVQLWQHDLARFAAMDKSAQDSVIGRERITNEEIADAPAFAHVKRTAQESFDPPAFVVRRSMPWSDATREGLVFVSFGATLDAYENQLRRMAGMDDGIVDGLFSYSTPLAGSYYWCPPIVAGQIALGGMEN